jgi:hypothetical protein
MKGEFAEMEVGNQANFPFGLQSSELSEANPSTGPREASMTRLTDTSTKINHGLFEPPEDRDLRHHNRSMPAQKALSVPTHLIERFNTFQNDLCTCVEKNFLEPT